MSRRGVRALLKLGLTAVVLGVTLAIVGVDRIVDAITRLDVSTWLFVFGAFFVLHAIGTCKWRFFMSLTGARLSARDAFRCYAAGLFANLCLPTMIGGDVLRAGLAMAATRQKTAVVLGSLVDRASDFAALVVLAVAGFVVAWHPASPHHRGDGAADWVPLVAAAGVGVLLLGGAAIAWRRWRPRGGVRRLLLEALVALRRLRARIPMALLGFGASTLLQFLMILLHRTLGIGIGMPSDLAIWLFIWPLAKLVAMIPISFGGLGVREAAFLGLARPFGIPESVAVASSLAWQAVMLLGGLIGGAVWLLMTWRPSGRPRAAGQRSA